jgi:hypothetical protein
MTAVEWVLDWMDKNQYFIGNDLLQAVEQAKEIEKEQKQRFNKFLNDEMELGISDKKTIERIHWYYNNYLLTFK